ncbi:hypothetical protein [Candidatus Spongiihabitans sp.]|uniref:hypothetical protein n=1 Tax=Candidatus Spongiihabitans sp. TaxID=3101308 RepID=UPI003C7B2DBB
MVNNCHALRDTKTCSGVAGLICGVAAGFVRNTTTITTIYWDAYNAITANVRSGDWIT